MLSAVASTALYIGCGDGWPLSFSSVLDGSLSFVCFLTYQGCRPQRWEEETLQALLYHDNTRHNASLIASIMSMAGLAHGCSEGSSPINPFFSD